jgi:hypothetical protein
LYYRFIALAELLPLLVQAPEPPDEPGAIALQEGDAQARKAQAHPADQELATRQEHLDAVAGGVSQRQVVRPTPTDVIAVGLMDTV